jgi:tetratricopeptide (TPR) repeat protein
MAFSPDGQIAALASGIDTVQLVKLDGGDEIATLIAPDRRFFDDLCFSPDGTRLAVAAAEGLQVWDLRAIRQQLAPMRLDWELLPYPPEEPAAASPHVMNLAVLDARFFDRRADAHAEGKRWQEALVDVQQAIELDPALARAWHLHGHILLASGDEQGYRRVCSEVVSRFPNEFPWGNVPRLLVLRPGSVVGDSAATLRQMVERSRGAPAARSVSETLGALLYRQGDYRAAVERLRHAISWPPDRNSEKTDSHVVRDEEAATWTKLFLAMAHQQLKEPAEARRWLALAERDIEQLERSAAVGGFVRGWQLRLTHDLLLAEARELIGVSPRDPAKHVRGRP